MQTSFDGFTIVLIALAIFIVILFFKSIRIVPQRRAFIIGRLGKYYATFNAGLHILYPFVDRVAYKHSLKEQAIDVESQQCITRDNITVEVDGILYIQVMDPMKASYGIDHYKFASTQIAQTTMRSIIGKLELDKTFEERETINAQIVHAVDAASDPWGVKVTRYEVKNITPPQSIKDAMEKQMRAVREKRAVIAESEGEKQKTINEADAKAFEIERVAKAKALGIREIANAINDEGGKDAVNLRIAEQYLGEFGKMASKNSAMIIPANLTDISSVIATATSVFETIKKNSSSE